MKMNNEELISQNELYDIMYNYLKPTLNECKKRDGIWGSTSPTNAFSWTLNDDNGYRYIGSYLYSDHWEIVNDDYKEENVNIKVFIDYVEFIEDSEFIEFDKEFMRGLYENIKEFVEGNNIKEENNKMGVQIENNNEGSKFESAMKVSKNATLDPSSTEWDKMSAMTRGEEYKPTNMRESKDNYYLDIAKAVAMRGTCIRRKFGAVIVNNDEIVSTGYVGAPRGRCNCIDRGVCFREEKNIKPGTRYELCRSVHAEMNAVISAGRNKCIGGTMYLVGIENDGSFTDADCCSMCKRVIINSGIEKVVFRSKTGGHRTVHVKEDWVYDDDSLTIHEGY
jgi:dCMP deaminase